MVSTPCLLVEIQILMQRLNLRQPLSHIQQRFYTPNGFFGYTQETNGLVQREDLTTAYHLLLQFERNGCGMSWKNGLVGNKHHF